MKVIAVILLLQLATSLGGLLVGIALMLARAIAVGLVATVRWTRPSRSRGFQLRYCPLCGGDAVDSWSREEINGFRARIVVHCAACGVSRRLAAPVWTVNAYECRYQKDSRAIGSGSALRDMQKLIGAEDFLAATRTRSAR